MKPKLRKGERIKDIKGYEGLYAITTHGRVWSYPIPGYRSKGKWLLINADNRGYNRVSLFKNKVKKTGHIHRLLAINFIKNPKKHPVINHIDGVSTNNNIKNLEWCSYSYNVQDYYNRGGSSVQGSKHGRSKLTEKDVLKIRKLRDQGCGYDEIALKFNVSFGNIGLIIRGKTWKHI